MIEARSWLPTVHSYAAAAADPGCAAGCPSLAKVVPHPADAVAWLRAMYAELPAGLIIDNMKGHNGMR